MKEKIKNFALTVTYTVVIGTGLLCLVGYMLASDVYEKAKSKIQTKRA